MKAIKLFGKCLFFSLSMLALSCSSDDDNGGGGGGTPTGTYIKGTVNGTVFQTYRIQGITAGVATSQGSGASRLISISGPNDMQAQTTFVINLLGIDAVGEYTIDSTDDGSVLAFAADDASGQDNSYDTSNCSGATGTINITSISATEIEGTFSFTGKIDEDCSQSKSVTNGSFRGVFM